jgi:ribosome-associated protein
MLYITETIHIPETELEWSFARSGGPGGQNVNKVESKAVLRWRFGENRSLPADARARLREMQPHRITTEGDFLITSQRFREQDLNRQDCLEKLRMFVLAALVRPKARKATKPTRGSKRRRVADKRRHSGTKALRRKPTEE